MPHGPALIAFIGFFVTVTSPAWGDAPGEITKLRAAFHAEIAKTGESQMRLYLAQLENLERILAAEGNFAGAIQAREESERLKKQIAVMESLAESGSGEAESGEESRILLQPGTATTEGNVTWDQDVEAFRGWRTPEDVVRWRLPGLPPGGYEVVLTYSASSLEGGRFLISEEFFTLSGKISQTDGAIVETNVGTLKIRSGKGLLSIRPTEAGIGGLMRLKSVELIPAWR